MAISGSNDISLLQMGIGLLPVGISLFLSWKYKLGLSKSVGRCWIHPSLGFSTIRPLGARCPYLVYGGGGFRVRFKTLGRSPE